MAMLVIITNFVMPLTFNTINMNMKKLYFVAFLSMFITLSIIAQNYTDFDISKYITPDIKRNALDLSFGMNENYNDDQAFSRTFSNFQGELGAGLEHYTHTRKKQSVFGVDLDVNGKASVHRNDLFKTKVSSFSPAMYIYSTNRIYNTSNNFWLIGGSARFSNDRENSFRESFANNEQEQDLTQNYKYANIRLNAGWGKGRIEWVKDAIQAVYIFQELSHKGMLSRRVNNDEIWELSQLVSTVKNKRFFDSRLHLIDEISQVDSFFVANDLIKEGQAAYFTTLYDYWLNAESFDRFSGTRFETLFEGSLTSNKNNSQDQLTQANDWEQNNRHKTLTWKNQFTYEKPVNLWWQNSAFALFETGYSDYHLKSPTIENRYKAFVTSLYGSYSWSYYPNTRTSFSADLSQRLTFAKELDPEDDHQLFINDLFLPFSSKTTVVGRVYYYISPQLRFFGNVVLDGYLIKDNTVEPHTNYFNKRFSGGIGLTYAIY